MLPPCLHRGNGAGRNRSSLSHPVGTPAPLGALSCLGLGLKLVSLVKHLLQAERGQPLSHSVAGLLGLAMSLQYITQHSESDAGGRGSKVRAALGFSMPQCASV